MRRTDLFKKFVACIIESNTIDKKFIIKTLLHMGIRDYVYYSDFIEALRDFDKYYQVKLPDFILSEWYDYFFNPAVIGLYGTSCLKNVPLVILAYDDQLSRREQSKHIPAISFIPKPVRFELLQTGIMHALQGKFNIRSQLKKTRKG